MDRQRALILVLVATTGIACHTTSGQTSVPIVQPGAPGRPGRVINAREAADLSQLRYTAAEIRFMQGMIGHHWQAVEMTALIAARTSRPDLQLLGKRIEVSQADEIRMMGDWLKARGEPIPDSHEHHAADAVLMPGMLTADEMKRLSDASGTDFDRLFLEFMIRHHEGALVMVEALFASEGAGQQSDIFAFASDVDTDQRMEISRMTAMLEEREP